MDHPPPNPPELPYIQIPPSDLPSLTRCIQIISTTIGPSPICLSLIADIDNLPPHAPITPQRYQSHFSSKIKANTKSGAIAVQAGNFSATAVWEPPGFHQHNEPNNRQCSMLSEWIAAISKVEMKYLGLPQDTNETKEEQQTLLTETPLSKLKLRPYWHLNYLSRNPDIAPVPGAISAVVVPFLQRAIEDNVPAWLEASSEAVIPIYEHYGFRFVEKVTIGIGRFGEDGWPKAGGEGVSAWAMIFDGHLN